jgi:hypothetical protein
MALIKIKKSNKYIIHAEQVCQKIIQKRRKEKYEDKKEKVFKNYIKKKKSSKFQEKKHYYTMHFDNTQVSHYTQPLFFYI